MYPSLKPVSGLRISHIILIWGIDWKGWDLFLNSCQHSIINIAQKRNAILPPASSTQLSANKEGIVFAIITANVWSRKEQLDFHTLGCWKHWHLVKFVFNFYLLLFVQRMSLKGKTAFFNPKTYFSPPNLGVYWFQFTHLQVVYLSVIFFSLM